MSPATSSAPPPPLLRLYQDDDRVRVSHYPAWSGTVIDAEVRSGDYVYLVRQDYQPSGQPISPRFRTKHWVAAPWVRKLSSGELYMELENQVVRAWLKGKLSDLDYQKMSERMDRLWPIMAEVDRKAALHRAGRHAKGIASSTEVSSR